MAIKRQMKVVLMKQLKIKDNSQIKKEDFFEVAVVARKVAD